MSGKRESNTRRSYRPAVEALEALRLLSSAAQSLPDLAVERDVFAGPTTPLPELAGAGLTWDEALTQSHLDLADIFRPSQVAFAVAPADAKDVQSGLSQLDRYLGRAWYRAGVAPQMHDDCTQAVYMTLLQNLGRPRFDQLLGDIGNQGIRDVLSRETADGPDFFRAIDTVKKRAQRERTFQPIDSIDVSSAAPGADAQAQWHGALQEAIDRSLNPREKSLVHDTLMGKTPAEIAAQWGVAPKTVSNEKTRVIQKLRDALVADLSD